jgi:hypothetical protein
VSRFARIAVFVGSFTVAAAHAAGLPDTGQDTCYNNSGADSAAASDPASIARDTGSHPRQDCRYGRDAAAAAGALTKTGAGAKGFDYTKIANNGATLLPSGTLGAGATDWACTKDNVTGLTWEVKTAGSADLRYSGHTYRWYSNDATSNGGGAGSAGSNTCNGTLPGGLCNTEALTTAVNAAALCTYSDWRLPTRRELLTLIDADGSSPSIVQTYFPNTVVASFWSGSAHALAASAWSVDFSGGNISDSVKTSPFAVRLVRGAQF